MHTTRHRGFTLIEVLVVVAVSAVLAALAYPSFTSLITKSRRSDAFSSIFAVQQAQERWRNNNRSYATSLTGASPSGLGLSSTSGTGYYTITVTNVSATGYTVVATAVAGTTQANDASCAILVSSIVGGVPLYGAGSAPDWSNPDPNRCWPK